MFYKAMLTDEGILHAHTETENKTLNIEKYFKLRDKDAE